MSPLRIVFLLCALNWGVQAAIAQTDLRLTELLTPKISAHDGIVAVAVKLLPDGPGISIRGDDPLPTASLIKFPVMVTAYQRAADGTLDLEQLLELKEADKVPGSGILTSHFSAGSRLSLRDPIRLMIVYSDNTATNLVLDQMGIEATSNLMADWGYTETRLNSKVYRAETSIAPERSRKFGLGSTTANEMVRLLARLHQQDLVSPAASKQMYDHLLACDDKSRLARLLPKGTRVALKTGSVSAARNAAGIIESPAGPIAICILTGQNKDQRWENDNAAERLCGDIAKVVYDVFNPSSAIDVNSDANQQREELAEGATGELVEALQRMLNRALPQSPLAVDGDFGPATKQAVMAFQTARQLPPTGHVSRETWQALGPLIVSDPDPAINPETVNREVLPQAPPDTISGPPIVTAKAWAIGEIPSGRILWQSNGDERRDFASTTKTMTAWLVVQEADRHPEILEQEIPFSSTADQTPGSTCGLKQGERIAVGDLLYGLMLPSGNDAAVALAEFMSSRQPASSPSGAPIGSIEPFLELMNRTAQELGMKQTHYSNPHGLPDPTHLSSAADQVILASRVMQHARFRKFVQTRQHAVRVTSNGGVSRNLVWKNTNELLQIAGYTGLKTGTTAAAGACLVSTGTHGEEELIVVVLGCASNESRYTDTRNLFRWAWQQRGHHD